jgi:hypothetical protein
LTAYNGVGTAPAESVYADAGIADVNSTNITALNNFLGALPTSGKDTGEEIQAMVNAFNELLDVAAGGLDWDRGAGPSALSVHSADPT